MRGLRVGGTTTGGGETGSAPIEVAELIRVCRLRAGLSARQLSALADLSPSYITKLEAGELEPSLRSFARIVRALRLTPFEVMFCVSLAAEPASPNLHCRTPSVE